MLQRHQINYKKVGTLSSNLGSKKQSYPNKMVANGCTPEEMVENGRSFRKMVENGGTSRKISENLGNKINISENLRKSRKKDAIALAQLVYDIYKKT